MHTFFKRQDWPLNLSIFFLASASLTAMASGAPQLVRPQSIWIILGFILILAIAYIDLRPVVNYSWMIIGFYSFSVVLLVSVLAFAPLIRESQSWLVFGPARFQPSELAKVALIILLAYFFARRHIGIAHVKNLFASFIYFLIPCVLILLQPDLGSALVLFAVWAGFLLVSGIRWRHLVIGIVLLGILGVAGWNFFLQPYHKERVLGFLNPEYDPLGINYSVIQSKIAIGSAGFFGKGFNQGTQTQLGFLTEPSTDFIFAAFVEEWGFIGGAVLAGVFFFLVLRIIRIGMRSENVFFQLVSLGAAILFLVEFFLNTGSNLGLLPVVGVTFPFFSYGGSSFLTKAMLVGIIQGIAARNSR